MRSATQLEQKMMELRQIINLVKYEACDENEERRGELVAAEELLEAAILRLRKANNIYLSYRKR